jgi:dTDP-4-amino-4,6-dideoxygalactose transaminase
MIPLMRPWLGAEEVASVEQVIASGWIAQGPRVAAFERAICERVGAEHGVALSSCTAALHLALVVCGIGAGDDVVVPSLSFIATANAVRYVGATPVFADVGERTQNVCAETIERAMTPATRAVIVVHQGGVPVDLTPVQALCERRRTALIEDAACALGSTYGGRPIGSHSELVAFSFHPRKLITTGEGGMVVTRRGELAARMRRLREHAMSVSAADRHAAGAPMIEEYAETGFNYRMSDLQAAVGLVQLTRLDTLLARRRALARRYRERLADVPGLQLVGDPPFGTTNFQSFWVVLPERLSRDRLLRTMWRRGIAARRGFMAAHLEPAYAHCAHGDLPVTERLTRQSLILPLFHEMTGDQQDRVIAAVRDVACGSPGS